ncbi:Transposon Ty3-I Gag-Pol polyprotein [Vitis vinifera]|uniref:Transposon Ty3-I Gag-Pol polyprotein n=1 Tax=Vitis vinifera TaxID=29760 RepID=A0A438GNK1_VITVI|nr:Transposon Ty3-I Gag-Pol polyprotein [Vitis vinifera]
MHYRQLMTLDIGNDALLCKVFPASLQGQALSWFHRLPPNSVDNFRDLSEAFVGQYLCSTRHKQNISTLQNIKMQENESLREFVKRFGQAVLQVEAYSMNAVLQIFKRSICLGTPFFESLAKKPPMTMDDLFRRTSKYSILEDDVRAATQQILVAGQTSRSDAERSSKLPDLPRLSGRRQEEWPGPIRTNPDKRDHSKKCAYHKERCRSLHYLVERLIKVGHLKQYLRSKSRVRDTPRNSDPGTSRTPIAPKAVINYIHGGPLDEEYNSKRKRQKLLRAASVRERVNSIRPGAQNIQDTLQQSHDIFAWVHFDMTGIHPSVGSHKLNVLPSARPIRQKVRCFHLDRQKIIRDKIDKLLEAGFIREVEYPDWLANVIVVPKKEGKWRVCVDYTNLNNACSKDSFLLQQIDQIVDSTAGQGMLSFLDAFFGYHQIPMAPADEEKTAFITPHGLYCYKVMSFGLKNVVATC